MGSRLGPLNPNYIIDTNILILFFAGKLQEPLPSDGLGISIVTEIELLAFERLSNEEERQIKSVLEMMERYPLSMDVKDQTIAIKRKNRIKLPDAIICATAIVHEATLLTNDKQLFAVPGLNAQSLAMK